MSEGREGREREDVEKGLTESRAAGRCTWLLASPSRLQIVPINLDTVT